MCKPRHSWPQASRLCRSTRIRKNWWATSRIMGASGTRKGSRRSAVYDFPIPGLRRATSYGIYDLGRNASWVNVGIDHDTAPLLWKAFAAGGTSWDDKHYPKLSDCSSAPMGEKASARACACGNGSCSRWPMRRASPSPCATCCQARANETRLSIVSSPGSARTGVANHSRATP